MGAYCNFCGARCFTVFPEGTPARVRRAYGAVNLIATCAKGQEYEQRTYGWCYATIQRAIALARLSPPPTH